MKIYGNILWQGEFVKGTVVIKDGYIIDFIKNRDYDIRGTVIPTLINMHTHIGDYNCREEPRGDIKEIVGPNGFKYKVLRNKKRVYWGMRRAMRYMEREGISHFVDFRECGKEGVDLLLKAAEGMKVKPIIFGREIVDKMYGLGLSSISDYDYQYIKEMVKKSKMKNKRFAIHVSERVREDIDKVLSLEPDFIVHMLEATDEDLKKVSARRIPIVITPRTNMFFGKIPNIPRFLKYKISLALGTDNGMISLPSLFREMEIAYKISRIYGYVSPESVLKMVTTVPRKILSIEDNDIGKKARIIIFKRFMSPYEIVTKATPYDIKKIIF